MSPYTVSEKCLNRGFLFSVIVSKIAPIMLLLLPGSL